MRLILFFLLSININFVLIASEFLFEAPEKLFKKENLKQQFIYDEKLKCFEVKEKILKIEDRIEYLNSRKMNFSTNGSDEETAFLVLLLTPFAISRENSVKYFKDQLENLYRLEKEKCEVDKN